MTTAQFSFRQDSLADRSSLRFDNLNYPVRLHVSVPDGLQNMPHLRQRLGLVLQQLAAHGRTGVVKGCIGENRGWRRSPLGGNGGMQYYLWWMLQEGNILVRSVRHHDDHEPLTAGDADNDYYPLDQNDIDGPDESFASPPWTENQLRFVDDDNPIRVVYGHPGSGKTTALYRAVETRSNQRVLYISWSRKLTGLASERFKGFAPSDVKVEAYDFVTLLGEICRYDIARRTYSQSRIAFASAFDQTRLSRNDLGPWAGREDALYAELRAILLGRAVPHERGCTHYNEKFWRLNNAAYRQLRGGRDGVGEPAADAFLTVIARLERHAALDDVFPELAAAAEAIKRLRRDEMPVWLDGFDRIAVDEIQDLTLTEIAVIVELCRAIARRRGYAPWLLIAGDEGQTVRPSGFEWPRLNELLTAQLVQPQEFSLDTTLRSPRQIAQVVESAGQLYADINRRLRPSNQQNQSGGELRDARLFYVDVPDIADAVDLLEQLNDLENAAVVVPSSDVPEWIPEHLRAMALTPADIKGLEYQSVCVLNPGLLLQRLNAEISEHTRAPELEAHYRRTAIDQFRVALSRAIETLVFVDVAADDAARSLSQNLLGDETNICSSDYLVEHFTDADATTDERVMARINQAKRLIDTAPGRAWERSIQAVRLLSGTDLDNEAADQSVQPEANTNLLATAARLLVDGIPPGVRRDDVIDIGNQAAHALETGRDADAFQKLAAWSGQRESPPFGLLNAGLALGSSEAWFRNALPSVSQTLIAGINRYAAESVYAKRFAGDVEGWLRLVRYTDNLDDRARELRAMAAESLVAADKMDDIEDWLCQGGYSGEVNEQAKSVRYAAAEALIQAGKTENVERFLLQVEPPDWELRAKVSEAQGLLEEAIDAYEQSGLEHEASRVRRVAAEAHFGNGQNHLVTQDWNKAIADFEHAIILDPGDANFYNSKGLAYFGKGQFSRAILDYSRAIDINPDNADFYSARGLAFRWKIEIAQAIEDYNRAIAINPGNANFYSGRGDAYARRCEFDRAIQDYNQAIDRDPNGMDFYISRGRAYRWKGDFERADRDFSQARVLGFRGYSESPHLGYANS